MACVIARIVINKLESKEEVHSLTFARLRCVLRALLAVSETIGRVGDGEIAKGVLKGLERIVRWFSGRSGMRRQFVSRRTDLMK